MEEQCKPYDPSFYQFELDYMKERAEDLEYDEWQTKADKILDRFLEKYYIVTKPDFYDVDKAISAKKSCITLWQNYFETLEGRRVFLNIKQHLRDYLDEYYDPCMESHAALEKHLNTCIEENRPEARRKTKLISQMISRVESEGSVPRNILLSASFDNCIPEEVKCCYRELIDKNRLAQIKIGNRYFVTLSDKEAARRSKRSLPDNHSPSEQSPSEPPPAELPPSE